MRILFLVLIYPSLTWSTQLCNPNDNCVCYPGLEIQCPHASEGQRFVVKFKDLQTTKIDCYEMTNLRMDLLPNITVKEYSRLEMSSCPLPPESFREITAHFAMDVKVIQFEKSNDVTLTGQYFKGLDLDRVKLNFLNFTYIDDDVFGGLSNLYSLDMESNRNLTLTPNLFHNLTKLHALYLPQNRLGELPEGLFDSLINLRTLHLWNNNLELIEDDTFSGLSNLSTLDIHSNKIRAISDKAFRNLTRLKSVNLSGNRLKAPSIDMFKHNDNISTILLGHNPGLKIPDRFFANFKSLQKLELSYCNLSSLPGHTFENSTDLRIIDLQKNKLTTISSTLFRGLVNLQKLNLQDNLISTLDENVFKDLSGLEEIGLSGNMISEIHHATFYGKRSLRIIDLSHNRYSGGGGLNILEDAPEVTQLDFSHNLLTKVEDVLSSRSILQLETFDLSYNRITEISLTDLQSSVDLKVCFDHNNITRIHFDNFGDVSGSGTTTISLAHNALVCDCRTLDLVQFLRGEKYEEKLETFEILTEHLNCESPERLKGQKLEDLAQSALDCDLSACPWMCSCSWRPFDQSVVIDCQNKNLTDFPIFEHRMSDLFVSNQTELHLEGNYLETGPHMGLQNYNKVTKLHLSYNRIKRIEWLPPNLKVLHLDNNQLSFLSSAVLDTLNNSNLVHLTLANNHWTCDCDAVNLTKFLRQYSKLGDASSINCDQSAKLLINLSETYLCQNNTIFYILIPVMGIVLIFMILVIVFYRHQQEIKVWLFAHDLLLWWVTTEELDKDKLYDAFISYSHKDEDFVVEQLVPVLERGPAPYKLCLHFRDWVPGEFIPTQVTNAVMQSRRTVIVLSANFLESFWGKMEFRTAHMHAMSEGRTRVIVVVYGDLDVDKLDDELKAYMKTNTYAKWGDPYFWDTLRYALPHAKGKISKNKRKVSNVMNCIDDKFTLVRVDKSSPGTTPPALSLGTNDLKKHPLDFVPRQAINAR